MESLESKWKQLRLTDNEDHKMLLDEDKLLKEIEKEKYSIVWKLIMDRPINKEVIKSKMYKLWKTSKPVNIYDVGVNMYIISFVNEADLNWFLSRWP